MGNYYIYSFDGKLLQMYDVYGALLKDNIYMGERLIAEYDHIGARFLYYTPDQINSTRVVTDSVGTVVYSAAHDPYGGIQQTWVNSFDPLPKFSGKERDAESGLDYFGARYYDRSQYRFISADPKLISQVAQVDPQRWGLYPYCANNPINLIDPSGMWSSVVHSDWTLKIAIMAGIPINQATVIARANNYVDNIFSGTSSITLDVPQRKDWHFVSTERYIEAIKICDSTLSAKTLGKYLHVIQDYFAHSAFDSSHPIGSDCDDPYSNYHDWAKTMEMAQLTLDIMQAFQERLTAVITAIVVSVSTLWVGI